MSVESVNQNSGSSVQSQKESSDSREQNLIAKQRREMADLQRRHQENMTKLTQQYETAMHNLRVGLRDEMSEKEKQHVKDVQGIQDFNRKYVERVRSDDDDKYQATKQADDQELERTKEQASSTQDRLTKTFDDEIAQKTQQDADSEVKYRDGSQEALTAQRKRLTEKADEEKAALRKQIQMTQKSKEQETTTLRRQKDSVIDELNGKIAAQKEVLDNRYVDALNRERARYDQSVQSLQQDFASSVKGNREKFTNKTQEMADQYSNNFDNLKGQVGKRVQNEVDTAKRENMDLRQQNTLDRQRLEHNQNSQTKDLNDEFKKNFDELEYRRQAETVDAHREKTRVVSEIQRERDRQSDMSHAFFTNKLADQKLTSEQQFQQSVGEAERERDLANIQKENTTKKIANAYADQTVAQTEFYEDQAGMHKKAFDKRLVEQRTTLEKQNYDDINNLRNQLAKGSVEHQAKLAEMQTNYEKQLTTMRSDYEKKLRSQGELFRDTTEKQVKGIEMDREASEAKLNARLAQVKETYEREMEQLRRRQAAERQELAQKRNT